MLDTLGRRLQAFVLAAAIVSNASSSAATAPDPADASGLMLSRAAAVADERHLLASLRAAHPFLFFSRTEHDVEAEARTLERRLPDRVTRIELFRALAPLVASFGDGHTFIGPLLPEYRAYRDRGGALFPLELDCAGPNPIVVADFDPVPHVPVGATVDTIGGKPARDVIDRLMRYEGGDTPAFRRFDACRNIRALAWIDGLAPPYSIGYHERGSKELRRAVLPGAGIDAIHRWDAGAAAQHYFADYTMRFVDNGAIAVLTMHSFNDPNAFAPFAANAFRKVRVMRSAALLIDVRENLGGDLALARTLMENIANRPYRLVAQMDTKVSRVVKNTLGFRAYRDEFGDDAWTARNGTMLYDRFGVKAPRRVPDPFRGRVYVLVGSGTFSSAAMFAAAVQDQGFGAILGTTSGGYATLYGERFDFMLPNSRLNVSVSTKRFTRPKGDPRLGPVVPDQRLEETAQVDEADDELGAAIDIVRRGVGRRAAAL